MLSCQLGNRNFRAVESVFERDQKFQSSLPLGFANNERDRKKVEVHLSALLNVLQTKLRPKSMVDESIEVALMGRAPNLDGHLLDLRALPKVRLTTPLRRRPKVPFRLIFNRKTITLRFHGKMIEFSAHLKPQMQFITTAGEFNAAGLPGKLDKTGRLVLVRALIREGFLTTCQVFRL